MFDKGLIERFARCTERNFVRLPYTEGIKILEEAVAQGHKFEFPCAGVDLASRAWTLFGGRPLQASGYPNGLSERNQGVLYEAERRW